MEPLLNAAQLGDLLGMSAATVQAQASKSPERLPPRVAAMRLLRWSPSAVRQWVDAQSGPVDAPRRGRRRAAV